MVSNTYIYILVDELCNYLVDKNPNKGSISFLWDGLKEKGVEVTDCAWKAVKENDKTLKQSTWIYFSNLSEVELQKITHDAVKEF